jgi:cytochrome b561
MPKGSNQCSIKTVNQPGIAYFTEDPLIVHVWAGYVVGALILARVVWGIVGPNTRASPISSTIQQPRFTTSGISCCYAGAVISATALAGASTFLAATVITGLLVYGGEQQAGPLAG